MILPPLGLVYDPLFKEHNFGTTHIESPERISAIENVLIKWPKINLVKIIPLRLANKKEITRVHTPIYLNYLANTQGKSLFLDSDTSVTARSYEISLLAAGSLIELCDAALSKKIYNGMALIRPPGHHATSEQAMGFCILNNIAIAATHLLEIRGIKRILIIDWDVHHGNGTENFFLYSNKVFYFSIHQSPLYPGSGSINSIGKGIGEGYTLNIPMKAGQNNLTYIQIFEKLITIIAKKIKPEFILISAGFDPHVDDPLGGMHITETGFACITTIICELAKKYCPGNLILTLEGGYNPTAQARSILMVLNALNGNVSELSQFKKSLQASPPPPPPPIIKQALNIITPYLK